MTYRAVVNVSEAAEVVKHSRFIAYISPVGSEEEALNFLNRIRKEHSLATHVCYAYIADTTGNTARFSDDGEPKGTAGKPILDVLKKNGLARTALAVVRYFGGTKLGAGGLLRAYTSLAVSAVEKSTVMTFELMQLFSILVNYDEAAKIKNVYATEYGDEVKCTFAVTDNSALQAKLSQTLGRAVSLKYEGEEYLPKE